MSIDECIEAFETIFGMVWSHPRIGSFRPSIFGYQNRYYHKLLEDGIRNIVRQYSSDQDADATFTQPNEDMCRR